jgi:hypothetical protein
MGRVEGDKRGEGPRLDGWERVGREGRVKGGKKG